MTLRDILGFLRRYWISITVLTVAGVVAGALLVDRAAPTYTASSAVFVSVRSAESAGSTADIAGLAASQARSYAIVAKSGLVLQPVIDQLGLPVTPAVLSAAITTTNPVDGIVSVTVTYADRDQSAAIAMAVTDQLVTTIGKLAPTDAAGKPLLVGTVITEPAEPEEPGDGDLSQELGIGFIAGLALGLAQAGVRQNLASGNARDRGKEAAASEAATPDPS